MIPPMILGAIAAGAPVRRWQENRLKNASVGQYTVPQTRVAHLLPQKRPGPINPKGLSPAQFVLRPTAAQSIISFYDYSI